MTTLNEKDGDFSGSDLESFEMPETVLCVDTICHICSAEFLDEEDLKLHITQQHITKQSRSRYCQFCSSIFASLEDYALHIIEIHVLSLKCCKYCMRAFTIAQDAKTHEKKHLNSSSTFQLSCSNCNLTFNNVSSLELHESSKHSDSKDGVLLRDCYSLLSSLLNIKAPMFLKSLGTFQKYKCVRCNLATSDVEHYIQHLQKKNCRSLACDKCYSVYQKLASLQQHFKTNSDCQNYVNEELQMPCTKCEKMFNYDQMQEHTKICQAVKCHSCDVSFEMLNERTEHQTKAHPLMFSIKNCKYCHRDFVGQDALEKHIKRTHEKDMHLYKYFCIYCNDVFKHPKKLFTHFLTKHKDLNPFTCKICDKTFRLRKNFTLHIKLVHSSIGTVKFDDNYHVIFEESVTPSTQEGSNENQDKPVTNETEKVVKDNSQPLLVPVEKKMPQGNSEVDLVLYPTENETDQPDKEKEKKMVKRRRKTRNKKVVVDCVDLTLEDGTEDSDDEPLIKKRRRAKVRTENFKILKWHLRSKEMWRNRQKFTCKFCNKYCYTYQNFNHHMSLHHRNQNKKCIKCPKVFKKHETLKRHIAKEHSTSKLTETLKSVLARRKNNNHIGRKSAETGRKAITEKFLRTIKKVNNYVSETSVKVTPIVNKLSAKKFIENFTPESSGISCKRNTISISNSLTIKSLQTSKKPPLIKLIKSEPTQTVFTKLKQPERFKTKITEKYEVSVKLADPDAKPKMNFDPPEEKSIEYEETYDDDSFDPVIPEVAEEVMLDETEEKPKLLHKIVLPNLPDYKDVHIAHLLPEAPYYKIVKMDEVLNEKNENENENENEEQEKPVQLPDGTKLVNVNPLAHLLEGKQLDFKTNKYYKPKLVNFGKALANALSKVKKTKANKSRKSKVVNEQ